MTPIAEWLRRIWYLLNRRRADAALREEMEAHRSAMADPARFGNTLRLREDARDAWGWCWLDNLARDSRFAIRSLRRTPGFTVVAIASLALGLALATSTVSVINAYLIRSLPYASADRLYHVTYAPPGPWEPRGMSSLDWTSVDDVVEFPITSAGETFYLVSAGHARSARALFVGPGFIKGLDVRAVFGRTLNNLDFRDPSDPAALIGYSLWRERYGSDVNIVGRHFRVEVESSQTPTRSFRVVGVLPPDFYFGRDSRNTVDFLLPLTSPTRTYMVRLRRGVSPGIAEQRITEAARRVASGLPPDWRGIRLESVHGRYVDQLRPALVGMTLAAGLVLVIVCANVAVLMVLRTLRRHKELAVRAALGAGRLHLFRMLAIEAAMLCVTALALGIAAAHSVLRVLAPAIETRLGRPAPGGVDTIAIDGTILLVAGVLGVLMAVSLSCLPLLAPWQHRLVKSLRRDGATISDGGAMRHLRSGLIALEIAATLILLIGCGLLIQSAIAMMHTDLGFDAEQLVQSRVVVREADYRNGQAFFSFRERFAERVSSATHSPVVFANWPPFFERPTQLIQIDGRAADVMNAGAISVGAGYFDTFGIPLRSGRDFTPTDISAAHSVAVISETLATRLWPNAHALGQMVRGVEPTPAGFVPGPWRTIVGVAADVRQTYGDSQLNDLYLPLVPSTLNRFGSFYFRHPNPPGTSLADTLNGIAGSLDPRAIVDPPRTVADENLQREGTTFLTSMLTGFAVVAAFLTILGIYGVTAYRVQQQEREIAIRMALGAAAGAITRLFVKEGGAVLAVGLTCGLIGAAAATGLLENRVYAVQPFDLPTIVVMCALLAAAGILASWWPAKRVAGKNIAGVLKDL